MEPKFIPLADDEPFCFCCSPAGPCFNACCRDLNQALAPYDILRLKNSLGLTSGRFLENFTNQHIGPESGLPVITLKPDQKTDRLVPVCHPERL